MGVLLQKIPNLNFFSPSCVLFIIALVTSGEERERGREKCMLGHFTSLRLSLGRLVGIAEGRELKKKKMFYFVCLRFESRNTLIFLVLCCEFREDGCHYNEMCLPGIVNRSAGCRSGEASVQTLNAKHKLPVSPPRNFLVRELVSAYFYLPPLCGSNKSEYLKNMKSHNM